MRLHFAAIIAAMSTACCVSPPRSQFPTAADALNVMKKQYACANGIQGDGKIDHFGTQGRVRGEVLLFAINPARVRVDVISPFGAMLFSLTSNGKDFKMLDTKEKQFLHGPAKACNLARMTQVPLPGHVLVSLLRGEAPLLLHDPPTAGIEWDDGHYRIDIDSKHDARQEIHIEVHPDDYEKNWKQQRVRVTQVNVFQRQYTLYTAELSNHEPTQTAPPRVDPEGIDDDIPPSGGVCNLEVPRSIQMVVPSKGDDVIFQYKELALNPPIPGGAFSQPTPAACARSSSIARTERRRHKN